MTCIDDGSVLFNLRVKGATGSFEQQTLLRRDAATGDLSTDPTDDPAYETWGGHGALFYASFINSLN